SDWGAARRPCRGSPRPGGSRARRRAGAAAEARCARELLPRRARRRSVSWWRPLRGPSRRPPVAPSRATGYPAPAAPSGKDAAATRGFSRRQRCIARQATFPADNNSLADSASIPRFNHVALSLPAEALAHDGRADLLRFYGAVFGWTEMPTMTVDRERLVLRCHSHEQF